MAVELFNQSLFNDANLLSYWRLEGNSNDSKGSLNGTDTSVTYGTSYGKFGQGGLFSKTSSSRITVTDPASLEFAGDFSVSIWFNRNTNGVTNLRLISKGGDGTYDGFAIWGSDTTITTAIDGVSAVRSLSADVTHLGLGFWQHVVLVRSGTSQITYLNGVSVDTVTASSGNTASTANFMIGNSWNDTTLAWEGNLDDVAIFSRALTPNEILNLYGDQAGSSPIFFGNTAIA